MTRQPLSCALLALVLGACSGNTSGEGGDGMGGNTGGRNSAGETSSGSSGQSGAGGGGSGGQNLTPNGASGMAGQAGAGMSGGGSGATDQAAGTGGASGGAGTNEPLTDCSSPICSPGVELPCVGSITCTIETGCGECGCCGHGCGCVDAVYRYLGFSDGCMQCGL
jgi:hypothetical protein